MQNQIVGSRIETRRKELGLTLDDIAQEIGVARSTVQRYEKGTIEKIKLPVIEAIARILSVDPAWLCGKTDEMNTKPLQKLCENLKNARKQKGLTQSQMADLIGVQRSVISRYESGLIEPSVTQIERMADALGVSLENLLGLSQFDEKFSQWNDRVNSLRKYLKMSDEKTGGAPPLSLLGIDDELFSKLLDEIIYYDHNFDDVDDLRAEMHELAEIIRASTASRGRIIAALDEMNDEGQSKVADYAEAIQVLYPRNASNLSSSKAEGSTKIPEYQAQELTEEK